MFKSPRQVFFLSTALCFVCYISYETIKYLQSQTAASTPENMTFPQEAEFLPPVVFLLCKTWNIFWLSSMFISLYVLVVCGFLFICFVVLEIWLIMCQKYPDFIKQYVKCQQNVFCVSCCEEKTKISEHAWIKPFGPCMCKNVKTVVLPGIPCLFKAHAGISLSVMSSGRVSSAVVPKNCPVA